MKVRVEVVCLNADGDEQRRQVLTIERHELAMETLGVNLAESKALLAGVQDFVVAQQACEELKQRRACPQCRRRYTTKDSGSTPVSTVFGRVEVPNPRWNRCGCQTEGPQTFRANQPRNAISGDEVGILDPVCKSDGFAEGSVAGG
jgi:hypothetical protein